jgi:hypothetical protein
VEYLIISHDYGAAEYKPEIIPGENICLNGVIVLYQSTGVYLRKASAPNVLTKARERGARIPTP